MKTRTKLMSAFLALVLVVSLLVACGTDTTTTATKTDENGTTSAVTSAAATGEEGVTEEDVYNEWWKLYIQRWNKLVPEVPLYSNQYLYVPEASS